MSVDYTSILNMGINPEELKTIISTNIRQVTQYFVSNNLHTNWNKIHDILLQRKQSIYDTNLKVCIKIKILGK
jgi:hypothetical protein